MMMLAPIQLGRIVYRPLYVSDEHDHVLKAVIHDVHVFLFSHLYTAVMTVDQSTKGKRTVEIVRPEENDDEIQAGSIRFAKLVSLWSTGELSAIQFTKATAVRI